MTVKVNITGLNELVADFTGAAHDVAPKVEKVTVKGALNVERAWKETWRNLTGLPRLAGTITHDVGRIGFQVVGEVGPDHRRGGQAALAHIPEYGMPQKNTAPHPGGRPAIEAEAPRYERALADVAEGLLK